MLSKSRVFIRVNFTQTLEKQSSQLTTNLSKFHVRKKLEEYFSQWQCSILVTCFPSVPRDKDTALSLAEVIVT